MKTQPHHVLFSRKLIALAVLAALQTAYAADDEVTQYTKPESSISVGMGVVSGTSADRARFGLFNGMREKSVYGLFDIDYINRDDTTGTWTTFTGHHLGLEDRDASILHQQQGDWKFGVNYSELVRHNPYTINTGELGAGTTNPTVVLLATPGSGTDIDLKLKREKIGVDIEKWITPALQFELNFKNEDKNGARLFGKGFNCSNNSTGTATSGSSALDPGVCLPTGASVSQWALLMLPEPIKSNTKQIEAKLNFVGDKLFLNGGYYGSFYRNSNKTIQPTVPGTLNNPQGTPTALLTDLQNIMELPIALPPDNQAHQLYLDGSYVFTPTTKTTFKYAYTHATQNEDFASAGLTGAPTGVTNLNGEVNSTLAQLGLTTSPISKLSLLANVRYEDKQDKTPIAYYNVEGDSTNPANFFTNSPASMKKVVGKVEGSYRVTGNYRITLGSDYELKDRSFPVPTTDVAGLSALRIKTEETGYRAELRSTFSETLSGAMSYISSKRTGSDWYSLSTTTNATLISTYCGGNPCYGQLLPANSIIGLSATSIFPSMFADRERNKWKVMADWSPNEKLSLQVVVEDGKDKYTSGGTKGLQESGMSLYSLDATYTLSEKWKLTGYASRGDQILHVNHSTGYVAVLRNISDSVGLGVTSKLSEKVQFGANFQLASDVNQYEQLLDSALSTANQTTLAATGGLPDVVFRQKTLQLYGIFSIEKSSAMRVDVIHQDTHFDEWTWGYNNVPFTYSDNTTVSQQTDQKVTFIGVTYIYKWQ